MSEIVIIGGGYSALATAKNLVKKGHNVTVISSTSYFEWSIDGSYSLVHPEAYHKSVSGQGKHHVDGAKHVVGTAVSVEGDTVKLQDGKVVRFDALVVAVGYKANYFKAKIGQSFTERQEEVTRINTALKSASTVLIGGAGAIALEFAGDVRALNQKARVVMVTSADKPLPYLSDRYAKKLQSVLAQQNIEVISGDSVDMPDIVLERAEIQLKSGKKMIVDAYIPAFSAGFNGGFTGLANDKGAVQVNEFLQATGNPKVFAVGCCDREFSHMVKINGQAKSVAKNVLLLLQSKPLVSHKEAMPNLTSGPGLKIGQTFAWINSPMLGAPLSTCCFACGFPVCPCICCWPLAACGCNECHPLLCGFCCSYPEGSGVAALFSGHLHGAHKMGIKGLGQLPPASAPAMQEMS